MYSHFYKENDIQSDYVYMCLYKANGYIKQQSNSSTLH